MEIEIGLGFLEDLQGRYGLEEQVVSRKELRVWVGKLIDHIKKNEVGADKERGS